MKTLLATMRVPFLVLTPVSILLGIALSPVHPGLLTLIHMGLIVLGGLLAHISVNMLNEYHDFRSGLDATTCRTPFSGGSGGLPDNPAVLNRVLWVALFCLLLTIAIGLYFVWNTGWMLLPPGLLGIVIVLTYTPWLNRYAFLCLMAPGIAFGPVMVIGSSIALGGGYTLEAMLISLVPFFLVNNLLLLNQFPDVDADAGVGRRHFPIRFGLRRSMMVYSLFAVATVLTIVSSVGLMILPNTALLSLLPMMLLVPVILALGQQDEFLPEQARFLGLNVIATILTPLVLSLSLLLQ